MTRRQVIASDSDSMERIVRKIIVSLFTTDRKLIRKSKEIFEEDVVTLICGMCMVFGYMTWG